MKINRVNIAFYSATGNTEKVVRVIGMNLARGLGVPAEMSDFTLPGSRSAVRSYGPGDLTVVGVPVYAGRIPNKILPYIQQGLKGNGALAVPAVTFGNRNYDDGLAELRDELECRGFHTVAGAAVACAHAFSDKIAAGRPDEEDMAGLARFCDDVVRKIKELSSVPDSVSVRGNSPAGPYYTPLGQDGRPASFLKARPRTAPDRCDGCGLCARVCPMGAIPADAPDTVTGICIKCQACVRRCPRTAKYFDDGPFLSHVAMLEVNYTRRAESEWFV